MIEQQFLQDAALQFRKLKTQADNALAQTSDEHFFATLDPEANSIALIMKHMAGNMRSRWTDFLTTDGEKPIVIATPSSRRRRYGFPGIHHLAMGRRLEPTP